MELGIQNRFLFEGSMELVLEQIKTVRNNRLFVREKESMIICWIVFDMY